MNVYNPENQMCSIFIFFVVPSFTTLRDKKIFDMCVVILRGGTKRFRGSRLMSTLLYVVYSFLVGFGWTWYQCDRKSPLYKNCENFFAPHYDVIGKSPKSRFEFFFWQIFFKCLRLFRFSTDFFGWWLKMTGRSLGHYFRKSIFRFLPFSIFRAQKSAKF